MGRSIVAHNFTILIFRTLRKWNRSLLQVSAFNNFCDTQRVPALNYILLSLSTKAEPTLLNDLLNEIAHLFRHYTQNVDCITLQLYDLGKRSYSSMDESTKQHASLTVGPYYS